MLQMWGSARQALEDQKTYLFHLVHVPLEVFECCSKVLVASLFSPASGTRRSEMRMDGMGGIRTAWGPHCRVPHSSTRVGRGGFASRVRIHVGGYVERMCGTGLTCSIACALIHVSRLGGSLFDQSPSWIECSRRFMSLGRFILS